VPDRDIIAKRIRSPWRSAARLWMREGATELTIDKCRATLAKALRDGGHGVDRARAEAAIAGAHLDREGQERLAARILVEQAVLAPLRDHRLAVLDAAEVHLQESILFRELDSDFARYASQVLAGARPRVRRRPRPDVRRLLESRVEIQL
jgi:hypothetical protein